MTDHYATLKGETKDIARFIVFMGEVLSHDREWALKQLNDLEAVEPRKPW